ncbi:(2Fe-2S)-binding protein [Caenibius tardaugens NBRC 16725]|nr:(2Fe-2S)-binding protein [Caenibius tardaugens NBRC 16725]
MTRSRDYRLGTHDFPRGWFMVADASTLEYGKPQAVRFFGRELVLYRGAESGKPILIDAYCPHMGTHLARNSTSYVVRDGKQIEGDTIRCPYHAWRFNAEGRCIDIPYARGAKIPSAARIKSWRVVEQWGAVFVWHDPDDEGPDWDLPVLAAWDDPAWVRWRFDDFGVLDRHPVEIIDNMADIAHQEPIHGQTVRYFELEIDGHRAIHREGGVSRTSLTADDTILCIDAVYHGPGLLLTEMLGRYPSYFLIAHTPVDDGSIRVWHALIVKSPHERATDEDVAMAHAFQEQSRLAFSQDFEVWTHKRPALTILQILHDGPYDKLRTWYSQFYNSRRHTDRARAAYNVRGMPRPPDRTNSEEDRERNDL